jgi:DNA-binding NarL/FixJ family response regulator
MAIQAQLLLHTSPTHPAGKLPTLMLADDHKILLSGLHRLLESDYDVVGTFDNGLSLLDAAAHLHPDVIVADISMPLMNGIEVAHRLPAVSPRSKLIILSIHAEPALIREMAHAGAAGYVLKRDSADRLIQAINTVLRGEFDFPAIDGQFIVAADFRPPTTADPSENNFTPRQLSLLKLFADGKSHKEIAEALHISIKTVEFDKYRLMRHLGAHSAAELMTTAVHAGILEP